LIPDQNVLSAGTGMTRFATMLPSLLSFLRMAALLAALAACAAEPLEPGPFYQVDRLPEDAVPGTVLRVEPMTGAPAGANALRILYVTTGLDGSPRAVSGAVIIPPGPAAAGGRSIVAWAHATTGVAPRCAPTLLPAFFQKIPGLEALLADGFVVVTTDYPGLGTAGPHPYLVGVSEAHAILDAVRAARVLPQASAGARFAVWGHSQGGHAALFAGEMSRRYAPELTLEGIAVAAPATDLATTLQSDIGSPAGRIITTYALWSWSRIYGASLEGVIDRRAQPAFDRVAADCAETVGEALRLSQDASGLAEALLAASPATIEPWRGLLSRNSPGQQVIGAPVFIAQSDVDDIVPAPVTVGFMRALCKRGEVVHYVKLPGTNHIVSGQKSAAAAAAWIRDRFAGQPAPNDCSAPPLAIAAPFSVAINGIP
jgi:alpha-beta hydrolase superfamily lysophospholipase